MARSIYWQLFSDFFKIGAFTLGGGYAMIPIIQSEVVDRRRWLKEYLLDKSEYIKPETDMQKALCAAFGTTLPSFAIILLIAMFFSRFQDNPVVESIFKGIRPAVVALIAAPTFTLAKSAKITLSNCWIPIGSALAIYLMGVNPVFIILAAGFGGYLYGKYVSPTE